MDRPAEPWHAQLAKQLARLQLDDTAPPSPEQWPAFLRRVHQTYVGHDQDRFHVERSLVVSSREMQELYDELASASQTELARERDKLAAVMHALGDAVLAFGSDGSPMFSNPAAERMFGADAWDLHAEALLSRVIPRNAECPPLIERARQGEVVTDFDAWLRTTTHDVPIACSVAPIREGERSFGYVFVARDETERQRTRAELARALDEAREAVRTKAQFLANMSHEIRTPMNGVIGMVGLLLDTELGAEQREFATTVKSSAEALLTIIDDILDFSKLEAGKVELESIDFDLRQCVEEVADLLAPKAEQKGLCFGTLVHRDVPGHVAGDPGRLRQVLLNLAGNAIKFTSRGEVLMGCERHGERLRFFVRDTGIGIPADRIDRLFQPFTQVDASTTRSYGGTGLGLTISQQLVEAMGGRIGISSVLGEGSTFFFDVALEAAAEQTDRSRSAVKQHVVVLDPLGVHADICAEHLAHFGARMTHARSARELELAFPFDVCILIHRDLDESRLVVEAWRGRARLVVATGYGARAEAESLLRGGADRALYLPLRHASMLRALTEVDGRAGADAPTPPSASERFEGPPRVLVVEDNKVNQMVARKMLEKLGCEIVVASNGREGLERALDDRFDIVLMDCQMPEMDGYEATRALRVAEGGRRHTRVVALTANAMPADVEKCLAAGMDDYLAKPVTIEALREKLAPWATAA